MDFDGPLKVVILFPIKTQNGRSISRISFLDVYVTLWNENVMNMLPFQEKCMSFIQNTHETF